MARRKKMGKRLEEARNTLGLSLDGLAEKIKRETGEDVGTSTIRGTELDRFPNPGIKTIEWICRGVELPPLEVLALHLDEPPPETKQRFTKSRFAVLSEVYESLPPARKVWFDDYIDMLIERMRKG
jgi:transcriptional regulator with XRE-family HTH domain